MQYSFSVKKEEKKRQNLLSIETHGLFIKKLILKSGSVVFLAR